MSNFTILLSQNTTNSFQWFTATSQFNMLSSSLGSRTKLDPYTLADSTSIRSTSYAFDFLSTTVGFNCSHSNDSCDNQIWRNHCNQEVIALAVHPQNLGRDLRLRWKENDGLSLALSGHRATEQKHPTLGAQGPSLQGTTNWRKVLLPPGTGAQHWPRGRALRAAALLPTWSSVQCFSRTNEQYIYSHAFKIRIRAFLK